MAAKADNSPIKTEKPAGALLARAGDLLFYVGDLVKDTDYAVVAHDIYNYTQEHPYLTTMQAVSVLGFAFPGLVAVPALKIVGFGPGGVGAKTLAALKHSKYAPVGARSLFATLQSAGAGGHGLNPVLNVVRAGAAATGSMPWVGTVVKKGKQVAVNGLDLKISNDSSGTHNGDKDPGQHDKVEPEKEEKEVNEQAERARHPLVEKPIKSKL
ncbi:MAG: hypothetical protein Q9225_006704 [Loekoesia sp. 1 TL-2023]